MQARQEKEEQKGKKLRVKKRHQEGTGEEGGKVVRGEEDRRRHGGTDEEEGKGEARGEGDSEDET